MAKINDLTGRIFGRLLVSKLAGITSRKSLWVTKCSCGSEVVVRGSNLTSGNTTSCGCFASAKLVDEKRADMTGMRFGRLVAVTYSHTSNNGQAAWNCLCDCGCSLVVSGDSLRQGKSLSCGCLHSDETSLRCKVDIASRKFGLLTAIREFGRTKKSQVTWLCLCDCGTEKVIAGELLRSGKTISCGCRSNSRTPVRSAAVREAAAPRNSARRARINGASGSYTKIQIDALYSKQQCKCAGCGVRLHRGAFHRDHIEPLSLGGSNDIHNIQLLCQTCNQTKHAKDSVAWAQSIGRLI